MTGKEKTLETLIEEAARARRCVAVLYGDSAADALEEYADELEAEIRSTCRKSPDPIAVPGVEIMYSHEKILSVTEEKDGPISG